MKLRELTGYKEDPYYQKAVAIFKNHTITIQTKLDTFSDFMKNHGFNILGSGIAGLAFEKNGYPWVFKIFHDDEGYLHFFNYAKTHQNNPNVPKTKGGALTLASDSFMGKLYLVRIEKLSPLPVGNEVLNLLWDIDFSDDLTPELEQKIAKVYPGIIDVLKDAFSSGYSLDLHPGNVMMRGNIPVIIDPLLG